MKSEIERSPNVLIVGNLAKDVILGSEKYGGCAATIAITLKNLGVDAGILSVVGRDDFSNQFIEHLKDQGIETKYIYQRIKTIPVCEVTSSENLIASSNWIDNGCHDAMDLLTVDKQFSDYEMIHLVSSPSILSLNISKVIDNLSYEPGPMLVHDENYFDAKVAGKAKLLFLNEEEYNALIKYDKGVTRTGYDFPSLEAIIVTLGSRGSKIINNKGEETFITPVSLRGEVVDSVGAGDNYKAGFLAGYLKGKTLIESAEHGSVLGAYCVQQQGGILPTNIVKSLMTDSIQKNKTRSHIANRDTNRDLMLKDHSVEKPKKKLISYDEVRPINTRD